MPMTDKDKKVLKSMVGQYGAKKGKDVFYASATAGKLGKDVQKRHGAKKKAR